MKIGGQELSTYESGDFFGELALRTNERRAATVRAAGFSTTVLQLPRDVFQWLVDAKDDVGSILTSTAAAYSNFTATAVGDSESLPPEVASGREALTIQKRYRGWAARQLVAVHATHIKEQAAYATAMVRPQLLTATFNSQATQPCHCLLVGKSVQTCHS